MPTPISPWSACQEGRLQGKQGRDSQSHRASSLHPLVHPAQKPHRGDPTGPRNPGAGVGASPTVQKGRDNEHQRDSRRQLRSGYKFYSVTNSTETLGLLTDSSQTPPRHLQHPLPPPPSPAAHVVCGAETWPKAPPRSWANPKVWAWAPRGEGPRPAVAGVQIGE